MNKPPFTLKEFVTIPLLAATAAPQPLPILMAAGDDEQKRKVQADRRRGSGPGGSGERKQAPAPQRRREPARPSGGGMRPPAGGGVRPPAGGTSASTGGGLPGGLPGGLSLGKNPIVIILVLIVMAIVGGTQFFGGEEQGGTDTAVATPQPALAQPAIVKTPAPLNVALPAAIPLATLPEAAPASYSPNQTWTILLYQDADDKILEQDILIDLNEAERVGSTDRVNIVAQIDRYRGGYAGDGDWSGTRRYYVTQDDDLTRLGSQLLMDLGELNMGDTRTLIDFVVWGVETYPADNYVLIMSDHGMGWPGGWTDKDPLTQGDRSIPLAASLGGQLYLHDLDDALGEIRQRTGIAQFELIGMDACLMGHLEVFAMLAPHARYAVASQEVEPALGWAYTGFLGQLVNNPGMSGADLAQAIVDTYIVADQRITDETARAQMTQRGSPLGGLFSILGGGAAAAPSAAQVAAQMGQGVTLTAVDLTAMPDLITSVNNFAYLIQEADQRLVAQARNYAQSFTSVFGNNVPPSYIDLAHFIQILQQESGDVAIRQSGDDLLESLTNAVIASKNGPKKPAANGISIYFPNSQLYQLPVTGMPSYTAIAARFAAVSLWDDFLTFHYTGRGFNIDAEPLETVARSGGFIPPGAGSLSASPVKASASVAAAGRPVLLSSDVSGSNIGHIYIFAGYYDQAANSIFVADTDYLESDAVRELDGVFYPNWGEGDFTLEFSWEPLVYAISDGTESVVALLTPRTFGLTRADATYTVDGLYTYASGEQRYARLIFRDGLLVQVLGFNGQTETGAPREILPATGDTFTVLEQWLDLDSNGRVVAQSTQEGGTLTFGEGMFFWEEMDAAAGAYVVGFIVEDLDGNRIQTFTTINVE